MLITVWSPGFSRFFALWPPKGGTPYEQFPESNKVELTSSWKENRVEIAGPWERLKVLRLGNEDLLLSKLMRNDPHDRSDALFIARRSELDREQLEALLKRAILPESDEIAEQFQAASKRLWDSL